MMKVGIISLFPEMFDALKHSITGRAQQNELISISHWDPRSYTTNKHGAVDDRPFGGGPGMVMSYAPIKAAIDAAKNELGQDTPVIYLSPQGERLNQKRVKEFSLGKKMILLTGRYEGIDQRLIDNEVDSEISLGDYVLSGGEIAAMALIDAITRLLPGALGDEESAEQDSFSDGLLDHPHYTRPQSVADHKVPEVLLNGDHAAIKEWRLKQALGQTHLKRPDLIAKRDLSQQEKMLLEEFINTYNRGVEDEQYN